MRIQSQEFHACHQIYKTHFCQGSFCVQLINYHHGQAHALVSPCVTAHLRNLCIACVSSGRLIPPQKAFTVEKQLVIRPTTRSELKEVCRSCKGMLCNLNEHGCSQPPHHKVVVLKEVEAKLYPLPVSVFVRVTRHILKESCQRHVKNGVHFAGVGCESLSGHQSANDRSDLELKAIAVRCHLCQMYTAGC